MNREYRNDNKEFRKKTINVSVISVISTLVFVAFLLLFVLFALKNCAKENNASVSSGDMPSSIKYDYDSELLNSKLKALVNHELSFNGFEDEATDIIAVTYLDNYPTNFTLNISSLKGTNLYFYCLEEYEYKGDISNCSNFVDYLLTLNMNNRIEGNSSLERLELVEERITTSKSSYKCVVGQSSTNSKYLFGYYYEENNYYIYIKKDCTSGTNPFISNPSKTITNQDPLFKYYQLLSR